MIVSGCALPDGPGENPEKLLKEIAKCVSHARGLQTRLRKSTYNPNEKAKVLDLAFGSKALLVEARLAANKRRRLSERETASSLLERSNPIFWGANPVEPVTVRVKPKVDGTFRPICHFGLDNMMMLLAGRMILSAEFNPKPWQCDYGNGLSHRGLHFAVNSAAAYMNSGWHYAVKGDVVRFFPSFGVKACQMAFPEYAKMIGHYLGADHMLMECSPLKGLSPYNILKVARRGGLVGSPLTAMLGGLIMSRLCWSAPTPLLNYADDFLILGKTKLEVIAALSDLKAKVEALPGGQFKMRNSTIVHLSEGISFLGHQFMIDGEKGRILCAQRAWDDFYRELDKRMPDLSKLDVEKDKKTIANKLGATWLYAKGWGNAFKLCEDVIEHIDTAKGGIGIQASVAGISWSAIEAYKDPSIGHHHPYAG